MRILNIIKKIIIFACFVLLIAACAGAGIGQDKSDQSKNMNAMIAAVALVSSSTATTTINLKAVAGTQDLNCTDTFKGHASVQEPLFHISESMNIKLVDLKFYVHDVKLIKEDGTTVNFALVADNVWQSSKVALLDFEDGTGTCVGGTKETNKSLKGIVPGGSYVGIEFKIGIPFELNHLTNTTQSAPLNNSTMYWSWQTGYRFMKFEYNATDGAGTQNQFHLGSNGCPVSNSTGPNEACSYPNRPTISIKKTSGALNLETDSIALDIKNLLTGTNSNITSGGSQIICHGAANTTTACQKILKNIGITAETGQSSGSQIAFFIK